MDRIQKYNQLTLELELARLEPNYTVEVECAFVEKLGDVWRAMTEEEQEEAERVPETSMNPMVDVALEVGDKKHPRKEAEHSAGVFR